MSIPAWVEELETVSVAVPDHVGRLAGKRIAASRLAEVAQEGLAMPDFFLVTDLDGEPILGLPATGLHTGFRNGILLPDLSTLRRLPWDPSTAVVLADALTAERQPSPQAVRAILGRQVERLAERGLSALTATELELYAVTAGYREAHASGYHGLAPLYHRRGDNDVLVTGYLEPYSAALRSAMTGLGLPPETTQGEGGPGQIEINFPPADPLRTADGHTLFKHTAKAVAAELGHAVTFMAKLDADLPGSSCHIHLSLRTLDGAVATADHQDPQQLSRTARAFLGGILDHTPDLALLHAPHVNSYKRLQPHSWAPTAATWGTDNRTVLARVLGSGPSLRIEIRSPGADANPYLALAAVLAAGIAGIDAGSDPGPPVTGDAYEHAGQAQALPADLADAVERFTRSSAALDAFGADVHTHVLGHARHELDLARRAVTDWERTRSFEPV